MNDQQLLRYSRHILLEDMGIEGQQGLLDSHAILIGLGGLGSVVALYLAASGISQITLVDPDQVDLTNLQRQIAHSEARIGMAKTDSAQSAMLSLNSEIQIRCLAQAADAKLLDQWLPSAQVVIDGSDNFATRQIVNAACVRHKVPLVSGSAIRMDGQLMVFDSRQPQSPCYACIFPADDPPEEIQCATMGVLAPLVGLIGSMQATEAVKILSGIGSEMPGRLLMLDGRRLEFSEMRFTKQPNCPVCGCLQTTS